MKKVTNEIPLAEKIKCLNYKRVIKKTNVLPDASLPLIKVPLTLTPRVRSLAKYFRINRRLASE